MSLGSDYCKQLKQELRRHANFPPNRPIALGDYGVVRDQVFERLGNIRQLGLSFSTIDGSGSTTFQFKSKGAVDFNLIAKGDITPGGIPAVKAGLELKFSSQNAVFFNAAGCTVKAIDDVAALEAPILALQNQGRWQSDFYLVSEINLSAKTTAIASADRDCEIKLEASSPAIESIQLADASLTLEVKRSKNTSLEIATESNHIPLMQLCKLRGFFDSHLRPESVAAPLPTLKLLPDEDTSAPETLPSDLTLEGVAGPSVETESVDFIRNILESTASDFEVARAITAYIPLLEASYAFAHGNENPPMPAGYEIVARIRAQAETEALDESLALMSPEALKSLENDMRALRQESVTTLEGIPSPDAFGFVVREVQTGAIIVSIRGTQTPEEWLKDFIAIPVPFTNVSDFGLVHLGFLQMWKRIRSSVFAGLQSIPSNVRTTFLGHSLGAAMATLGTVEAKRNLNRTNVDLCTFGSPRTGKVKFRVNFNHLIDRCFRVAALRDIVPHVPSVLTAWNHVGLEIEVRSKVANAHSLESYLEGLHNIGQPMEGGPLTEAAFAGVVGGRVL